MDGYRGVPAVVDVVHEATAGISAWTGAVAVVRLLDEMGTVAVFLTQDGKVVGTTPNAERHLANVLSVGGSRILALSDEDQIAVDSLVGLGGATQSFTVIGRHNRGQSWALRCVELDEDRGAPQASQARKALIFARLDSLRPAPDIADGLIAMGLVRSEARVAAYVASGGDLREIADTLGLTETTVRSYLKRIYSKLHLSGQRDLTVLVHSIGRLYAWNRPLQWG